MPRNRLAADMPPGTKLFYPDQEGETVPMNDPALESVSAALTDLCLHNSELLIYSVSRPFVVSVICNYMSVGLKSLRLPLSLQCTSMWLALEDVN